MNTAKFRTRPCRNFHGPNGCNRGENCHFIHDLAYTGVDIPNFNLNNYNKTEIPVMNNTYKKPYYNNMPVEKINDDINMTIPTDNENIQLTPNILQNNTNPHFEKKFNNPNPHMNFNPAGMNRPTQFQNFNPSMMLPPNMQNNPNIRPNFMPPNNFIQQQQPPNFMYMNPYLRPNMQQGNNNNTQNDGKQ